MGTIRTFELEIAKIYPEEKTIINIMETRKEKTKRIFGQILEPFALGLLALLFILPAITVINLTPITNELKN